MRLYARVGQALIQARFSGGDVFAAIEAVLPWPKFESTVAEAQTLAQPEAFDFLALLDDRYSSVRKFAPLLLAHFEFHAAPAAAELLQALDLLRDLNASGKRTLPEHVPTGFTVPPWYCRTASRISRSGFLGGSAQLIHKPEPSVTRGIVTLIFSGSFSEVTPRQRVCRPAKS